MAESQENLKQDEQEALTRRGEEAVDMGFSTGSGFALLQRVAKMFSQSSLVPKEFQGNIANCVIALNMANRLKADPLMCMQNLYVVYGRPAWSAQFLIATVNQCGRFSALRYEWQSEKGKPDWGCRAWAVEKATGEKLFGTWITWELANSEGWVNKNGSKWKTMPEQMFVYRAGAWFVKAYAPELSMGLPTAEEMNDIQTLEIAPGVYEPTFAEPQEPEKKEPGEANGEKAAALTETLKQRRGASAAPAEKEAGKPAEPEAAKPASEAAPKEEAKEPAGDDDADNKIAEQRATLDDLFKQVGARHNEKFAKERLEIATGFRTPARVKEEKLGSAIDAMIQVLDLPAQK